MRGTVVSVLVLVAALVGRPASAGLYNMAEPAVVTGRKSFNGRDFLGFRNDVLIPLRQIVADNKDVSSPLRKRYDLVTALQARATLPELNAVAPGDRMKAIEQRLDLSEYLIRVLRFRDAANLLRPAQFQDRSNFLVLSNLATAEFLDGQSGTARDYVSDALRLWPEQWSGLSEERRKAFEKMGWKGEDFSWFREVETYQLKLIRVRLREKPRPTNELPADVDALFDAGAKSGKLEFIGPSGKYEAGKLAPEQRAKLPKNAIEIVEQLLVWMPHDTRLYWLLGELFNAEGDVNAAREIFEEVAVKWDPTRAKEKGTVQKLPPPSFRREQTLPSRFKEHLEILEAQSPTQSRAEEPSLSQAPPVETPPVPASTAVDWKSLGVGFAGGVVVAILTAWQVRDLRRRRSRGVSPPRTA
jgi:tetratricopeptide (TPR) repeat protein